MFNVRLAGMRVMGERVLSGENTSCGLSVDVMRALPNS